MLIITIQNTITHNHLHTCILKEMVEMKAEIRITPTSITWKKNWWKLEEMFSVNKLYLQQKANLVSYIETFWRHISGKIHKLHKLKEKKRQYAAPNIFFILFFLLWMLCMLGNRPTWPNQTKCRLICLVKHTQHTTTNGISVIMDSFIRLIKSSSLDQLIRCNSNVYSQTRVRIRKGVEVRIRTTCWEALVLLPHIF